MYEFKIATFIGLTAAVFTTVSFLPQAVKVIVTKQTKDLSLSMYIILSLGTLLWLTYGIILNDLPIILANAITCTLSLIILSMKIKYR